MWIDNLTHVLNAIFIKALFLIHFVDILLCKFMIIIVSKALLRHLQLDVIINLSIISTDGQKIPNLLQHSLFSLHLISLSAQLTLPNLITLRHSFQQKVLYHIRMQVIYLRIVKLIYLRTCNWRKIVQTIQLI